LDWVRIFIQLYGLDWIGLGKMDPCPSLFDFGWGSAPDLVGGAYSAPPGPLAGFQGPASKGN